MENSFINIDSVAVIGNFMPRKCGIATFTTDLVRSLTAQDYKCLTVAINDKTEGYDYPPEVGFEINQDSLSDYHTAADFLNTNEVEIVSLQHEFGIFGGSSGDYILSLINDLKMPVTTTLHTVLTDPTIKQKQVLKRLADLSDRFVVMSKTAVEILNTLYDIPREKIDFIPHGIPDMPFGDPNYYKDQFDLLGKKVLLTFGLLSRNKGIEYVINGLPKVVERFPGITYIVLGATHPHVVNSEGEKYRNYLHRLVNKLDLENHVIFKNNFVPFDELCEYLSAADLYITPYVQEEQITSGTLAYAAGMGKAIISTPYWYAKEMLSDGRGKLVPFKNENAMAGAITELFENEALQHQMRIRSYEYNRNATWKEVARQYGGLFKKIKSEHMLRPRPHNASNTGLFSKKDIGLNLPRINLDHLARLTDDTGILQHAAFSVSNRNHGYCSDDNARALIVAVKAQQMQQIDEADNILLKKLKDIYLGFLLHAFNPETGRFYNFMSYSRQWLEEAAGSEDAHGRALWALGITVSNGKLNSDISLASNLFLRALSASESFRSPRAIAFTILGIDAYLEIFSGDSTAKRIYTVLAERLCNQFESNAADDWPWLENLLAYDNAKIPHALLAAGSRLHRREITQRGLNTLKWLLSIQIESSHLVPVGNHGWFERDGHKARFDQQPLEAYALVETSIAAYQIDGKQFWVDQAEICFSWFLGNNDLRMPMYNPDTGGCRDGLHVDSANQNEGAESTLAWLLSLLAMYQLSDNDVIHASKIINRVKQNINQELN